jgi:hypothetical protein
VWKKKEIQMPKKNHRLNGFARTVTLLVLGLAILPPVLGAKEREGAHILVTKNDGAIDEGELLAVTNNNLIVVDESTSVEITTKLTDVQDVKIVKSKTANGLKTGFLAGATVGAILGAVASAEVSNNLAKLPISTGIQATAQGALLLGAVGAILGGVFAGKSDISSFRIKDASAEEIDKTMIRLRKLAREQG